MFLSQEHNHTPRIGRLARACIRPQDMALAAMMVVCSMVSWAIADCLPSKWAEDYRSVGVVLPSLPVSLCCLSHLIRAEVAPEKPKVLVNMFLPSILFHPRITGFCHTRHWRHSAWVQRYTCSNQAISRDSRGLFPLPFPLPLPYHTIPYHITTKPSLLV